MNEVFEVHNTLNSKLFDEQNQMRPKIKNALIKIADQFVDSVKEKGIELSVVDYFVLGSNAGFNYGDASDIDLHIIVEHCDDTTLKVAYDLLKSRFNDKYNITVKGCPVEVYIQAADEPNASDGIYSLLRDEWLKMPERKEDVLTPEQVDNLDVLNHDLYKEWLNKLNNVPHTVDDINNFLDELALLRRESLKTSGEFGIGNLIFKQFRNDGEIKKIRDIRDELLSKELSLEGLVEDVNDVAKEVRKTLRQIKQDKKEASRFYKQAARCARKDDSEGYYYYKDYADESARSVDLATAWLNQYVADNNYVFSDADDVILSNIYDIEYEEPYFEALDVDNKKDVCCICGCDIEGYGNNAAPVKDGRCCDKCNIEVVVPARLGLLNEEFVEEAIKEEPTYDLVYDDMHVVVYGEQRDADDWDEDDRYIEWTYTITQSELDEWLTGKISEQFDGTDEELEKYINEHRDELFDKYYGDIKDYFESDAEEDAQENNDEEYDPGPDPDEAYERWRDEQLEYGLDESLGDDRDMFLYEVSITEIDSDKVVKAQLFNDYEDVKKLIERIKAKFESSATITNIDNNRLEIVFEGDEKDVYVEVHKSYLIDIPEDDDVSFEDLTKTARVKIDFLLDNPPLVEAKKKSKKRRKSSMYGMGWWSWLTGGDEDKDGVSLNPDAGDVEYNVDMFNHMTGADGGDFGGDAGAVGGDGGAGGGE